MMVARNDCVVISRRIVGSQGGLTNGRKGLLQYHKFLFSLDKTIQPLAIQVTDGPFVSRLCSVWR